MWLMATFCVMASSDINHGFLSFDFPVRGVSDPQVQQNHVTYNHNYVLKFGTSNK